MSGIWQGIKKKYIISTTSSIMQISSLMKGRKFTNQLKHLPKKKVSEYQSTSQVNIREKEKSLHCCFLRITFHSTAWNLTKFSHHKMSTTEQQYRSHLHPVVPVQKQAFLQQVIIVNIGHSVTNIFSKLAYLMLYCRCQHFYCSQWEYAGINTYIAGQLYFSNNLRPSLKDIEDQYHIHNGWICTRLVRILPSTNKGYW